MSFSWLFYQKCAVSLLRPSWKQKRWSLLLAYRWRCLSRRQGGWKGDRLPPASSCGLQGDALHIAKLCLTDVAHALLTSRLTELSNTSAHTAHSSQFVAGAGHGWPASRKEWGLSYIYIYTRIDFVLHCLISVVFRHRQLILLQVWHWLSLQKDCRGLSEGEPVWFSLVRQLGTFIAKWRMACFSNFLLIIGLSLRSCGKERGLLRDHVCAPSPGQLKRDVKKAAANAKRVAKLQRDQRAPFLLCLGESTGTGSL